MFSSGQLIFAVFFVIAFTIAMIYTYRKDLKLHQVHYKNIYIVVLTVIAIIALFTVITFSMH
jgi:heme/copper-type cytochrome/quinol oxidase subunit 2